MLEQQQDNRAMRDSELDWAQKQWALQRFKADYNRQQRLEKDSDNWARLQTSLALREQNIQAIRELNAVRQEYFYEDQRKETGVWPRSNP